MPAAAANSVSAVVRDLICCMCNGIGSAAGIIVGNELGAGHLDTGKAYEIKLRNLSYAIGFLSTALVLVVTPLIVSMWLIAIPLALIGAFVLYWPPLAVYACTCLD